MAKNKIIVIGGGMAGLVSAIQLSRQGQKVTLLEKNNKLGKKILVTGNGRCNISHVDMNRERFHSSSKNLFDSIFSQCDWETTSAFLRSIGIETVTKENGRIYPQSLQASSVVKALLMAALHAGVDIKYNVQVNQIDFTNKFVVYGLNREDNSQSKFYGSHVIVTTGGKSYSDSGSTGDGYHFAKAFGHQIVPLYKTIVQLKTQETFVKALKGLKADVVATIYSHEQKLRTDDGEVLFTDYGLSGPVILQLSTMVGSRIDQGEPITVKLDVMPEISVKDLDNKLMNRFHQLSYMTLEEVFNGFINQRLIQPMIKQCQLKPDVKAGNITKEQRKTLVDFLKGMTFSVTDTYLWNQAQATKGGVSCLEVHPDSLESTKQPGLFFAGEVLDIDGDCGGFNLQWALSSGYVVASSIERLSK
jgi:predicted Rossmann fold flavoprotein